MFKTKLFILENKQVIRKQKNLIFDVSKRWEKVFFADLYFFSFEAILV
jgi:hypothetical protein